MRIWYFGAKSDLAFMQEFRTLLIDFCNLRTRVGQLHSWDDHNTPAAKQLKAEHLHVRAVYARAVNKADEIARNNQVAYVLQMYDAPVRGGRYLGTRSMFQGLLDPPLPLDVRIDPQSVVDVVDQTIGQLIRRVSKEKWWLLNPLYWIYSFMQSIIGVVGLSKVISDQTSAVISQFLTALVTLASPWIKDLIVAWFSKLFS